MRHSSLFSGLIAVLIVISFENHRNNSQEFRYLNSSWINWERRVFDNSLKLIKKYKSIYEKNLKNQINQQVLYYKTGLNKNYHSKLSELIVYESKKYGYDPLLLTAVIITESSFNNYARSSKGALGLMQIRPATGKELASEVNIEWNGSSSLYDPETNIALGAYYLNKLFIDFGDLGLALEAYNHGPSRLKRYLKKGYRPKIYSQKVFKKYNGLIYPSI
jgi:soluble lytic murein transglycosylase-like protein